MYTILHMLSVIMLVSVAVTMFGFFDYEMKRYNKSITHIYY